MSRVQLTASQLDRIEDALEGLEDLGLDDPLLSGADDESRVVAEHLDAYRQILVLTRDAMPLEDAPMGVLDGVIAAAHAAASSGATQDVPAVAATPTTSAEDQKSWWQRLHAAVWVPALGFAGAAALLLLVMQPGGDMEEEAPVVAQADADDLRRADEAAGAAAAEETNAPASEIAEEGRLADSVSSRAAEAEDDLRGAGVERRPRVRERNDDVDPFAAADDDVIGGVAKSDKSDAANEDGDDQGLGLGATLGSSRSNAGKASGSTASPPPPPKPAPNAPSKKAKTSSTPSTSGGGMPGGNQGPKAPSKAPSKAPPADPAPEPEPDLPAEFDDEEKQKTDTKNDVGKKKEEPAVDYLMLLQRGEKARKLGKCGSAKLDFNQAKTSPDSKIRARSLAGLGLCALSAGNEGTAESLFSQARKADGSVGSFISRERALIEGPAPQAQEQTKD